MAPLEISQRRILLGEGKDEEFFFKALLGFDHIRNIQVMNYGGRNNLANMIKAIQKLPSFGEVVALGVTRDADESENSAKESIVSALERAGLQLGSVQGQPTISMHVLHCDGRGMLEDVCWASLASRPERACVDSYLDCCVGKGQTRPPNLAKARVHAWLAGKDIREYQLGRAVGQDPPLFDFNHEVFIPLRGFVREISGV